MSKARAMRTVTRPRVTVPVTSEETRLLLRKTKMVPRVWAGGGLPASLKPRWLPGYFVSLV